MKQQIKKRCIYRKRINEHIIVIHCIFMLSIFVTSAMPFHTWSCFIIIRLNVCYFVVHFIYSFLNTLSSQTTILLFITFHPVIYVDVAHSLFEWIFCTRFILFSIFLSGDFGRVSIYCKSCSVFCRETRPI